MGRHEGDQNGFSVANFVPDGPTHVLRGEAGVPPARLRAKRYFSCALLIIDKMGFRLLDRAEANHFFRLVSTRYERGNSMLTPNMYVRDWLEIFAGDDILATTIFDQLLHHVAVVQIDGLSYRLRELGALLAPPRTTAAAAGPSGHPRTRARDDD